MADGNVQEQWLVWLINNVRLDPEAAAARFGIDLNEGLPAGTLQLTPMQPMAMSDILFATTAFHGNWMLENDVFDTIGIDGTTPGDRIEYAGYESEAEYQWTETIGWKGFPLGSMLDLDTLISNFARELLLNADLRENFLRPETTEIGVSQLQGDFYQNGSNWYASMLTIDTIANPAARFITGQVWNTISPELVPGRPYVGVAVAGLDDTDTTGTGGGYTVRATSDVQVLDVGNARISLVMPEHNVQIDYVNNLLVVGSATFTLLSSGTNAQLSGSADLDLYAADSAGATWLVGNRGDNHLFGNFSNNKLDGGIGADTLEGGGGNDTYYVDNLGDQVIETIAGGYDKVVASSNFTLTAGSHVELVSAVHRIFWDPFNLTGNELSQTIEGNYGQNTLDGGGGGDILDGGNGDDTYVIRSAADKIVEIAGAGNDTLRAAVSYVLKPDVSIERLLAMQQGTGAALAIDLTGNNLAQRLEGNSGKNRLDGGGGGDVLLGGDGDDTYVIRHTSDFVDEVVGKGNDRAITAVNYTLQTDAEVEALVAITATSKVPLELTGNKFGQVITGNAGANILKGLAGDDTLDGGSGADSLYGGQGDDIFIVGNVNDMVFENKNEGTDLVRSAVSFSLVGQYVENLTLTGTADIDATGNNFVNVLIGNGGDNILDGGKGGDQLYGGWGDDIFIVENAYDQVFENKNQGTDLVNSSVSFSLVGQHIENLKLTGAGNMNAMGNGLDNVIKGNVGSNQIDGGLGSDTLTGGADRDQFIFSTALKSTNVDTITDFRTGTDDIGLSMSIFAGIGSGGGGGLDAAFFKDLGDGPVDANDRILFDEASGDLYYDRDGSGAAAAIRFATLAGGAVITAEDFFLI